MRKNLWFEVSHLCTMSAISTVYHILYGLGFDLGVWFRHIDWIFAYTTGPIFINCFFMEKHSYIKMVSNFWIFAIVSTFVNSFAASVLTFGFPVFLYTVYLFSVRNRHFKDLSKKRGTTTLLWMTSGILLFFLADFLSCKVRRAFTRPEMTEIPSGRSGLLLVSPFGVARARIHGNIQHLVSGSPTGFVRVQGGFLFKIGKRDENDR